MCSSVTVLILLHFRVEVAVSETLKMIAETKENEEWSERVNNSLTNLFELFKSTAACKRVLEIRLLSLTSAFTELRRQVFISTKIEVPLIQWEQT